MENGLTFQLNPLVEAQKDFDVMETRLFYLGLQDINPHITEKDKYFDKNFPDTIITPSELKKIFGHGQYIRELDKATDRLIGRYISIKYEDGFDKYTIFQHVRYKEGKGLFIKFNEDMRPFILDIYKGYKKYGFTKIEMQQIFFLGSAYAMRLLELLLQYKSTAKKGIVEREISIDDLRKKLNVPNEAYKNNMSNFRQFVLDKPIKDINKNTQYTINYETVKKGRSVTGFIFFCNCNKATKDEEYTTTIEALPIEEKLEKEAGQEKLMDYPSIEEQKEYDALYKKLNGYGFSISTIGIFLQDYCGDDMRELKARLEYGEKRAEEDRKKKKPPKRLSSYLRKAIQQNWLGQARQEEEAQARELEATQINAEWELWALQNFKDEPAPKKKEKKLDVNNLMHKTIITTIKKDLLERNLSATSKNLLAELGLTVSRFAELYMKG